MRKYSVDEYSRKVKQHTESLSMLSDLIYFIEKVDSDNEFTEVRDRLKTSQKLLEFKLINLNRISDVEIEDVGILKVNKLSKNKVIFENGFELRFEPEFLGSAEVNFVDLEGTSFHKEEIEQIKVLFESGGITVNGLFLEGKDIKRVVMNPDCHVNLYDDKRNLIDTLLTLTRRNILTFTREQQIEESA